MKQQITRGHISELEAILINIQNSIDHYFDLDEWSFQDIQILKQLRAFRKEISTICLPRDIDYEYWCAYKHAMCASGQLKELVQFQLEHYSDDKLSKVFKAYKELEDVLQMVRLKFFKIDPESLDDPRCIRCLEDFFISKFKKDKDVLQQKSTK